MNQYINQENGQVTLLIARAITQDQFNIKAR